MLLADTVEKSQERLRRKALLFYRGGERLDMEVGNKELL
jgi:hypothetical protein